MHSGLFQRLLQMLKRPWRRLPCAALAARPQCAESSPSALLHASPPTSAPVKSLRHDIFTSARCLALAVMVCFGGVRVLGEGGFKRK